MSGLTSSKQFMLLLIGGLSFVASCSRTVSPARQGQRGESCQARNDCQDGLACVSSTCVQNDFAITPSARECDFIECTADADCCVLSLSCEALQSDCQAGDTFACNEFEASCGCSQTCDDDNRCRFTCEEDVDCGIGFCDAGVCVGCRTNDDCLGGLLCDDNECVEPCESTSECPYFHQCTTGLCTDVGCQTDRECVAFTDNPNATCATREGEPVCEVPCENDAECNGGVYSFQACVDGSCVHVGCTTDEECRIALGIAPGADSQAVCR